MARLVIKNKYRIQNFLGELVACQKGLPKITGAGVISTISKRSDQLFIGSFKLGISIEWPTQLFMGPTSKEKYQHRNNVSTWLGGRYQSSLHIISACI